jgi:hypothetical protein
MEVTVGDNGGADEQQPTENRRERQNNSSAANEQPANTGSAGVSSTGMYRSNALSKPRTQYVVIKATTTDPSLNFPSPTGPKTRAKIIATPNPSSKAAPRVSKTTVPCRVILWIRAGRVVAAFTILACSRYVEPSTFIKVTTGQI